MRRAFLLGLLCCLPLTLGAGGPDPLVSRVRSADARLSDLERKANDMERSADRYEDWQACTSGVPVSEYGDPDAAVGYRYDRRNGTGRGYRPALAVGKRRRGKPDYLFLDFARRGCDSAAPQPGGTAEPAAALASRSTKQGLREQVRQLERRVSRLRRAVRRVERASERFDDWEACVSLVGVTEYGDPDGAFGYLYGGKGRPAPRYRAALAIDRSDWDDPDYFFLAFVGANRPGVECRNEPGEGID